MSKNGHCYSRETIFDTTVWILQVSTTGQVSFGSPVTSSMSGSIPRGTGPPFIAVNWYPFQTYSNSSYNKGRVYYRSTTSGRVCCYKFPSWIVSLWLLMLSHRPTYNYTGYRIQWRRYTLGRARSNENDLAEELPPCLPPWLTNISINFKPVYVNKMSYENTDYPSTRGVLWSVILSNSFFAGALPRTPVGELTTFRSPRPSSRRLVFGQPSALRSGAAYGKWCELWVSAVNDLR